MTDRPARPAARRSAKGRNPSSPGEGSTRVSPYAHRYAYLPADPRWARVWPQILEDARTIVEQVRRTGVVIAGPDGLRRPIFDPGFGVEFNGDATTALAICRTGAKPYDLAVAALLLRCAQLVPDVFALDSDGGWDTQWLTGHHPVPAGVLASPRNLVGMLFEPYPDTSPFTDITAFLSRHR